MPKRPDPDRADIVAAEVSPRPGNAPDAARILARLGFEILHVGTTISVRAPVAVWNEHVPGTGAAHRALRDGRAKERSVLELDRLATRPVPEALRTCVESIVLAVPPDLHEGRAGKEKRR